MFESNHIRWWALALTMTVTVPCGVAAQVDRPGAEVGSVGAGSDARETLAGTFHFVGGERQTAALGRAINDAVAAMPFFKRPWARGRLRPRNALVQTVAIRFPPGRVEVSFNGGAPFRSPDDGTPAPGRAITGDALRVRQHVERDRLVQTLASNEGTRRDEFVVSPDGQRLTMHVTVTSSQLPRPLRYDLDYAR
jgi:hypothetical protein